MGNYFNRLSFREKLEQLGVCEFLDQSAFSKGVRKLKGKHVVILGCGAQGLNQGLNLRDSGLKVSFALRDTSIKEQRASYRQAVENKFPVGNFEELIPQADLVANLTPDKQHDAVVKKILPLMKSDSFLLYSHGFHLVEQGAEIRPDITVIMVAPKAPGTEVRSEYRRGFGVPTLVAVHPEHDPRGEGFEMVLAYAAGTGAHRAGVLRSSFAAEVKSDLMGEQTILCGMLQAATLLSYDHMTQNGIPGEEAAQLLQYGWETISEALKHGGITHMMNRFSNPAKVRIARMSAELKVLMKELYEKHMDDILDGTFSRTMMKDWEKDDKNLLQWRQKYAKSGFEKAPACGPDGAANLKEQDYFDRGLLLGVFVKAGVELCFETMLRSGFKDESAYYESLHELPLIANLIGKKRLYEMNRIISDTAEYGCYLFARKCIPLLKDFMKTVKPEYLGKVFDDRKYKTDNQELIRINREIQDHPIEKIGRKLRGSMKGMKSYFKK